MRLVTIGLSGYKRFARETEMNVDGAVIAVVGPNEAGKSSLLAALTRLNDGEPFASSELTREMDFEPDHEVVWALYTVEEDDRRAISDLDSSSEVRWLVEAKQLDGTLVRRIEPPLTRDRRPRRRAIRHLERFLANARFREMELVEDDEAKPYPVVVRDIIERLNESGESLAGPSVKRARHLLDGLTEDIESSDPKYVAQLPARLAELLAHETEEHPNIEAASRLVQRIPLFLLFSDADRALQSDYELVGLDPIPRALANLAALGELDVPALRAAAEAAELGAVEQMTERANERLRDAFAEAWRQYGVRPRIRLDGTVLSILVSTTAGGYDAIAQRSDGLRAFVALFAYTTRSAGAQPPILLVDEAENHLHYDAQADLVRVFTRQRAAQKVMYTTHSAGCLPEDLGTGVRVAAPDQDGTSELRNAFWADSPGYSGLLLGMGATALAFAATRYAVIAEGASDMILVPSVLRAATGRTTLGFQVAPGLAEINEDAVREIDLEAARIAYLVDSDEAGRRIARRLLRAGIPGDLIVQIGTGADTTLVLEDLIDPETYAEAVSRELRRSHGEIEFHPAALPEMERPRAVTRWCRLRRIDPPNKRAVAFHILDLDREGQPIASRPELAIAVFDRLLQALRIEE